MFSALFGNFIFGRSAASAVPEITAPESTEVATQTSPVSERMPENVVANPEMNATQQSTDWVIVERGEEENLMVRSETKEAGTVEDKKETVVANEEDNVWLGSFFERNQNDDQMETEDEEEEEEEEKQPKQWEITPLPCLTSITDASQQRSMLTTDPLENLLIEHPSMSVFVAGNGDVEISEDESESDDMEENVLMHLFDPCYETEIKKQDVIVTRNVSKSNRKRLNKQKTIQKIKQQQQQQKQTTVVPETPKSVMTSSSIKRKEAESSTESSPSPSRKKDITTVKKSKKSASATESGSLVSASSPLGGAGPQPSLFANKENAKALLSAELKCKQARKQQQQEMSKQLKRANRQALAQKNAVANQRNRKYHRLHQPSGGANTFFATPAGTQF